MRDQLNTARDQERVRNSHFVLLPPLTDQQELIELWREDVGSHLPAANQAQQRPVAQAPQAQRPAAPAAIPLQFPLFDFDAPFRGFDALFGNLGQFFAQFNAQDIPLDQRREVANALINRLPHYLPAEKQLCTICQEEDDNQTTWMLLPECKHTFHRECLRTWFTQKIICPNCNGEVR